MKALGESRANGNGITPPDTPRRSASPRSGPSPKPATRSSSPVAIPGNFLFFQIIIVFVITKSNWIRRIFVFFRNLNLLKICNIIKEFFRSF